jgi:hypothetical protein
MVDYKGSTITDKIIMKDWNQVFYFFEKLNFQLLEQSTPPQPFGNYYYVFSNGHIDFRIASDRNELSFEIRFRTDSDWWFDVSLLRYFLYQGKEADDVSDIDADKNFIIENIDVISDMFSDENYSRCKNELIEFSKKIYRQRYGDNACIEK